MIQNGKNLKILPKFVQTKVILDFMERFFDTQRARILVIEDAPEYQMIIRGALGQSENHVYVSSLNEANAVIHNYAWDLIIIDVGLKEGNGIAYHEELCRLHLNDHLPFVPVLFLSELNELGDNISHFEVGGFEIIEKPFQPLELRTRAKNKIEFFKRIILQKNNQVYLGNLQLDKLKRKIYVGQNGEQTEVGLSKKEFDIIVFFVENKDAVLSRELLLSSIWGEGTFVLDRSVDSVISEIRKKIKNWNYMIKTIYGVGYVLRERPEKKEAAKVQKKAA